jgi:Icc-related predicted phosphoesterase
MAGYFFYGLGGGIPVTPFGSWSFDFSEEEGHQLLEDCPENAILISHSPPLGILDLNGSNEHCGSKAVREFIESKSPVLVVCGHVHESNGKQERYKDVDVINCGPSGMIYELPDLS